MSVWTLFRSDKIRFSLFVHCELVENNINKITLPCPFVINYGRGEIPCWVRNSFSFSRIFFKSFVTLCRSFWILLFLTIIHTVQSYIHLSFPIRRSPSFLYPHRFFVHQEKNLLGVPSRESNSTRARFTVTRRTENWATPHPSFSRISVSFSPLI